MRLQGHSNTTISPDSLLVASGSYDNTVRIWSIHAGSLIHTLEGHENSVIAVQFSPDGRRIVSQSLSGTIILWDTERGERMAVLHGGISVEVLIAEVGVDYRAQIDFGAAFGKAVCRTMVKSSPQSLRDIGGDAVVEVFSQFCGEAYFAERGVEPGFTLNVGLGEEISTHVHKPVCFSVSGASVILESRDDRVVRSWNIVTNPELSSDDDALPMVLIPTPEEEHPKSGNLPPPTYRYSRGDEWVLDQGDRRICWIPADQRGFSTVFRGNKLVLGSRSGKVSLLDFSGIES